MCQSIPDINLFFSSIINLIGILARIGINAPFDSEDVGVDESLVFELFEFGGGVPDGGGGGPVEGVAVAFEEEGLGGEVDVFFLLFVLLIQYF